MICPKCKQEFITKIKFSGTAKYAYICDFCEAFWFTDEIIRKETAHSLRTYFPDGNCNFTFI
jgi:hypothetical protein